jgi:hypothetical protein
MFGKPEGHPRPSTWSPPPDIPIPRTALGKKAFDRFLSCSGVVRPPSVGSLRHRRARTGERILSHFHLLAAGFVAALRRCERQLLVFPGRRFVEPHTLIPAIARTDFRQRRRIWPRMSRSRRLRLEHGWALDGFTTAASPPTHRPVQQPLTDYRGRIGVPVNWPNLSTKVSRVMG